MKHTYYKVVSIVLLAVLSLLVLPGTQVAADPVNIKAESAILIDAETGKILYAKNADIALPPASMTKIMTEYLVWEAIEKEQISWDTTTQISDYAYSISANKSFSGVGLKQNTPYTVKDLYKAMAINSDNATTIALAELISGTETEFAKKMNDKAKEMGLTDYNFINATGLDNKDLGDNRPKGTDLNATNLFSARSAALLAYNLIKDYPEALEISSIPETTFDKQTIRNWNYMLPHDATFLKQYHYDGVDGLKTGFTDLAGYCFTGTAKRDGKRLISVVMKTHSEKERFQETAKLLDYGFMQFENKELFKKGYKPKDAKSIPVEKGKDKKAEIGLKEAINIPIRKGEEGEYKVVFELDKSKLNDEGKLVAPIKKGTKVGTAKLVYKNGEDPGYISDKGKDQGLDVVATKSIDKDNWFMLTLKAIGNFFVNLFSTIFDTVKGWFFVVK